MFGATASQQSAIDTMTYEVSAVVRPWPPMSVNVRQGMKMRQDVTRL